MVPIQPFLDKIHRVLLYLLIFMMLPTHVALVDSVALLLFPRVGFLW